MLESDSVTYSPPPVRLFFFLVPELPPPPLEEEKQPPIIYPFCFNPRRVGSELKNLLPSFSIFASCFADLDDESLTNQSYMTPSVE